MNGQLTLEFVKTHLRVDIDDDDAYIEFLIEVARESVISYVGECDETKAKVRMLMLGIIGTLYEQRTSVSDKSSVVKRSDELRYTYKNLIMQLQMERGDIGG